MYSVLKSEKGGVFAVRSLLKRLLTENMVDAVFVAAKTPYSDLPMPTLISSPENIETADPLAPVAPFNASRQASILLRSDTGKRLALVLRPCEIRALIELVKLKQCVLDPAILIGIECKGRMENALFLEQEKQRSGISISFYQDDNLKEMICSACNVCDHFQPVGTDLTLSVFGVQISTGIGVEAESETGTDILKKMGYSDVQPPAEREAELRDLQQQRLEAKSVLMEKTAEDIKDIKRFETLIANCLNCSNCRVACPVCYCKECVFVTDVFAHEPELLIRRAVKRGMIKMPTETTMFHLTRLAHIGHACVACGHCTSVCPSGIPVADFFITVGSKVQDLFDYEPGRDINEPIPYLVFEEENQ